MEEGGASEGSARRAGWTPHVVFGACREAEVGKGAGREERVVRAGNTQVAEAG